MSYKIDDNLEKETKQFIKTVIKKLKQDNEIDDSWFASFDLMADNYNTFLLCKKQISVDGLTVLFNGNIKAHPLVKIQNDAQIQLTKLLIEFGLTLKSGQKIGVVESAGEPCELDTYISNKIKNRKEDNIND